MNILRTKRSTSSPEQYHLFDVDEATMMTIIMGIRKQLDEYKADLVKAEFGFEEDQQFLRTEIRNLEAFILETERYIVVDENGFEIK